MITQQHNNEIQHKAQTSALVKEHLWIVVLLSTLGIALPLVAGSMVSWPWGLGGIPLNDWFLAIVVPVVVPVTIGAFLLCFAFRTWWVAVFAGAAWVVGEFLAAMVHPLVVGGWPELQATQGYFWWLQGTYIKPMLGPLLLGMALGATGAIALDILGKRSSTRQMDPLLRAIAIVVSLVSGMTAVYLVVFSYTPWQEFGFENLSTDPLAYLRTLAYLLVGIVALGGAMLFRSWWAILVVPLAIGLGVVLTNFVSGQIVPDLLGYDDVGFGVFFDQAICIISAVIGACIGSPIGVVWKKRQPL